MIPTTNKAELHLTYRCNLRCVGCNRLTFLEPTHTPDMTLENVREFFRQAETLGWRPRVIVIGGEPTLHPDFLEAIRLASEFARGDVQVWSNAFTPESQRLLEHARARGWCGICGETAKPHGPVCHDDRDVCVSLADFGETRPPCFSHASVICGISVDAGGYAPCAMGGAIDAALGLGVRTRRLADLFDEEKNAAMTARLCQHCGWKRGEAARLAACEQRHGIPMSATWLRAIEGR